MLLVFQIVHPLYTILSVLAALYSFLISIPFSIFRNGVKEAYLDSRLFDVRDQLYKNESSRKIDSQRLFSRE